MPFVGFFSGTFWPAAMLRIALWAGQNVIYIRLTNPYLLSVMPYLLYLITA
jgi:hypothetical protein